MSRTPDLLTPREVMGQLRIGRTSFYTHAKQWRATGGQSGIKVIEVGGQLRVPRVWLEELIGAPIEFIPEQAPASNSKSSSDPESNDNSLDADGTTPRDDADNKRRDTD